MSDFIKAQKEILSLLKEKEQSLINIRESNDKLIEKWQRFLSLIIPIEIRVIRQHDYPANQKGFTEFNQRLMEEIKKNPELKKINEAKWSYLLQIAFDITEIKHLSLEEAQNMTREITQAMTSEEFLKKIDHVIQTVKEDSMIERSQGLLDLLLPAQMEVMERYGFIGEKGYIQAQRAMMDFFFDPIIITESQKAQEVVFKRAKLMN